MKTPHFFLRLSAATMLTAVSFVGSSHVFAAHLTPEEALARVSSGSSRLRIAGKSDMALALSVSPVTGGESAVYVFTCRTSPGFLIVSADDCAPAVLGYSDTGSFDSTDMAPALKYWIEEYAREISFATTNGAGQYKATERPSRNPIAPLTSTKWNQDAPYNNLCPTENGKRCVTGCVATALSQVMRYHSWPAKGTGSNSYSWNSGTLSLDFSTVEFDWINMLDTYGSDATDAQETAVATLMYAAGISVSMDYTPSESGAAAVLVPAAMVNYFNYDKGIRYMARDYYGLQDWEDIVYNQLVEYGPVQYSGQSNSGGHSFVCDGYSTDGYFHINWGWGGMSDGYFLLTALNPESQGIGGSTSGYNFSQSIVANVSAPKTGSQMYPNLMFDGNFTISQQSATVGSEIEIGGPVYNFSIGNLSGTPGIKITAADGTVTYAAGTAFSDMPALHGLSGYEVILPSLLADGTYTVTPAFLTTSKTWQDIPVKISDISSVTMTVSGGTCYFSDGSTPTIEVSDITTSTPFYFGSKFMINATLTNSSSEEFYGTIAAAFVDTTGNLAMSGEEYPVDLQAGESMPMEYLSTLSSPVSGYNPQTGEYTLYFINTATYQPVSEGITVTVNAKVSTSISVSDLHLKNRETTNVDKNNLNFEATVNCTAGYFGGTLTVAIFPYDTSGGSVSSADALSSEPLFIQAGESGAMTATGSFPTGEAGKVYGAAVFNGSTQLSDMTLFTLSDETGINDVETATVGVYPNPTTDMLNVSVRAKEIIVFNTAGAEAARATDCNSIDLSAQPAGIYFVKVTTNSESAADTFRIIKK